MSLIKSISFIWTAFLYLIIVLLLIVFLPGIPPNMKFEANKIKAPFKLEPNGILDKAEAFLDVVGAEMIAFRPGAPNDEDFYACTDAGSIIHYKDGKFEKIVEKIAPPDCGDCPTGRGLGIRFSPINPSKLIITDILYGLFELDIDTGILSLILSTQTEIGGKKSGFPVDVEISKDGTIYWADGTTNFVAKNHLLELISGEPSGRVLKFDQKKNISTIIADRGYFPHGVQLSPDESELLFTETGHNRIKSLDPEMIRSNGKGGYYIPIVNSKIPCLLNNEFWATLPLLRKLLLRIHAISEYCLTYMDQLIPSTYLDGVKQFVNHLGPLFKREYFTKKVIILDVDAQGNVTRSLQNSEGEIWMVASITIGKEYAYFGTPFGPKIYRIKLSEIN